MKALCWQGRGHISCDTVPDPTIEEPRDVIVKVTSTAICGSDLHLMDGYIPTMEKGDILGHEFMGEVVEVGSGHKKFAVGDRILVPFTIWCGECFQCRKQNYSVCERSNRNAELSEKAYGHRTGGLFGYSHLTGGYAGGQAQFVRVPFADAAPMRVPEGLSDEQVLFLTDIFPTGWQAALNCDIHESDVVAVWGCGPVGQFAIRSAFLQGAKRVIAIDCVPERLAMAETSGATVINFKSRNVLERLNELTDGRGPEKCIDSVGMEAHASGSLDAVVDKAKQAVMLETDRPHVLREAIYACQSGGTVSVPGVYGGILDSVPFGAVVNKGLTIRSGQTNVNRYLDTLLDLIVQKKIDPSSIITHEARLEDGPSLYKNFRDKEDGCIKVVLHPN
jgi:threonine dehydrogenase-like Zn-dependent dehydrogenase